MFGIDSGELLIIALVALLVIGPKDLPRAMRTIGQFVGRARGMARHFRSGIDTMIREAELEDMEKQWKANNERIMRDHPDAPADSDWGKAPAPPATSPPPPESPDVAPELPLGPAPSTSDTAPKRKPPARRAPRPRKTAPGAKDGA
ncbi:MAG: Sec-independent protein translocase protein TatB [Sphingomonas sp.]|nr:Sec-independent protein translocase protein TatB [Sphingomonas sp.]